MECMQLLKYSESKYKPNVGEIFSQYTCKFILNKHSSQAKSNLYSELFGYLATGRVNIRIHRDITGEMWFGVGYMKIDNHTTLPYCQVIVK